MAHGMKGPLFSLAARAVSFPATAAATLATTYITISYAGANGYGSISLIAALVLLVPFADLGLGAVVINQLSKTDDGFEQARVVAGVFRLLLLPAALLFALGIFSFYLVDWAKVLGLGSGEATVQRVVVACLLIFSVSIPLGVGQRALIGLHRTHIAVLLASISSLVALSTVLLMSSLGLDALYLALAVPIGNLALALVCTIVSARFIGHSWRYLFKVEKGERLLNLSHFSLGLPMLVVMIGLPIAFQSQRIILSHESTPEQLAQYALVMQLYVPIWSFVSVAATALWPVFARLRAQGDIVERRRQFFRAITLFGMIGLISLLGMSAFGGPVGDLVSSGTISLGPALCVAAALLLFVQSLQQVPGMFLTAVSGMRFQAVCVILLALLVVVSSWIVASSHGAVGVVLCLGVGVLVCQVIPGYLAVLVFKRNG